MQCFGQKFPRFLPLPLSVNSPQSPQSDYWTWTVETIGTLQYVFTFTYYQLNPVFCSEIPQVPPLPPPTPRLHNTSWIRRPEKPRDTNHNCHNTNQDLRERAGVGGSITSSSVAVAAAAARKPLQPVVHFLHGGKSAHNRGPHQLGLTNWGHPGTKSN